MEPTVGWGLGPSHATPLSPSGSSQTWTKGICSVEIIHDSAHINGNTSGSFPTYTVSVSSPDILVYSFLWFVLRLPTQERELPGQRFLLKLFTAVFPVPGLCLAHSRSSIWLGEYISFFQFCPHLVHSPQGSLRDPVETHVRSCPLERSSIRGKATLFLMAYKAVHDLAPHPLPISSP